LKPTFADAAAPNPRTTQYFEMLGSRALWHDGWKVTTDHVGQQLTADQIRDAFDAAFGRGAGRHVGIVCYGHGPDRLITEVRIYLAGDITNDQRLADLLANAPPARESCPAGKVDPVGFDR
jgi:ribonuclease I